MRALLAAPQASAEYAYACNLAVTIWQKRFKQEMPEWKPCDDLIGVLTQIDNMVADLVVPQDVRNAALEEAATAVEDHRREGRGWVPGSFWDSVSREAGARIRALKQPQADNDGGHQEAENRPETRADIGSRGGQLDVEAVVLPPLPEALALQRGQLGHTDQTMDCFARAAVLADRQQRATLSSDLVGGEATDADIRAIFMAHGFTVKEGQTDLKPYVYAAARALLSRYATPQASAMPPLNDAMRAVIDNERDVYASPDALYAALCDAAGAPRASVADEGEKL